MHSKYLVSTSRPELEVQSMFDYSYKLKKQSVKPQGSNASMCCMCHTQYIKFTDNLMICERCDCWCCIKCLKISFNEHKVLNSRSDCHWFCPECEEQALTDAKNGMDIEPECRQYLIIIIIIIMVIFK